MKPSKPASWREQTAPTVLSAFTGAGGLDLGLERAGFHVIACIENDDTVRKTIRANRPDWRLLSGDITELATSLTPEKLSIEPGDLGLLSAGPPCQPFSKAAQWSPRGAAGLSDPRIRCFEAFLTLVGTFLPKVVLIENVPGFAVGKNTAIPIIRESLDTINQSGGTNYQVEHRVIITADYGVAQRRKRAIVIALREGERFQWPEPTHKEHPVRSWDAIGELPSSEVPRASGCWADLLPSIPEGSNYQWHTERGGGQPLFGYRTRYWSFLLKLAKNQPAWTLPATPGPSTGPFHWDNRPLTVKEMLRLQSFPKSWKVIGSYRKQVEEIGNATPPLLAEVLGRAIGRQFFELGYNGRPTLHIPRKRKVPPPSPVRSVPRKFHNLEGDHPPHPGPGQGPKPTQ